MAKWFYSPPFEPAYIKGSRNFPPSVVILSDMESCTVGQTPLASRSNPLFKGEVGRHRVECDRGKFSQTVLILRTSVFLFRHFP